MIDAKIVKDYPHYTIEEYTYSADISATGEELTMYEVWSKDKELLGSFTTLEEAVDYIENQTAWDRLIDSLPPCDVIARH